MLPILLSCFSLFRFKKAVLFIALFLLFSNSLMSHVYIDYKIYTEDFFTKTKWEVGEEEAVWNIKYQTNNTAYSAIICIHDKNNYGRSDGHYWSRDEEEVWSGSCLDTEDALTIYLEGWEDDAGEICILGYLWRNLSSAQNNPTFLRTGINVTIMTLCHLRYYGFFSLPYFMSVKFTLARISVEEAPIIASNLPGSATHA